MHWPKQKLLDIRKIKVFGTESQSIHYKLQTLLSCFYSSSIAGKTEENRKLKDTVSFRVTSAYSATDCGLGNKASLIHICSG